MKQLMQHTVRNAGNKANTYKNSLSSYQLLLTQLHRSVSLKKKESKEKYQQKKHTNRLIIFYRCDREKTIRQQANPSVSTGGSRRLNRAFSELLYQLNFQAWGLSAIALSHSGATRIYQHHASTHIKDFSTPLSKIQFLIVFHCCHKSCKKQKNQFISPPPPNYLGLWLVRQLFKSKAVMRIWVCSLKDNHCAPS